MTNMINHFGHFYLTYLVFDLIKKSREGRIINVSSLAHTFTKKNIADDLNFSNNSWGSMESYAQSKLANVLFANSLADIFEKSKLNIKAVSLHLELLALHLEMNFEKKGALNISSVIALRLQVKEQHQTYIHVEFHGKI